jgi:Competence protein CoiA-like family
MWLEYGIDANGETIFIESRRRGKTDLHCPYCGGALTAKKGAIKNHHFAHTDETCRAVSSGRDIAVPFLAGFDRHLSSSELAALIDFHKTGRLSRDLKDKLARKDFIVQNANYRWKLDALGEIACGVMSLDRFSNFQSLAIVAKLKKLETRVAQADAENSIDLPDLLTDLKLYKNHVKRILTQTLYYLKIVSNFTTIYKIGVTTREISERIDEIEPELQAALGDRIRIETIGLWENHGGLERYFIYKYQKYRCQSIKFTEYFEFPSEIAIGAIEDLHRLSTRTFRKKERDILNGISSKLETQIELKIERERQKAVADKKRQHRSSAIKTGMQRAKNWGTHTGRPSGSGECSEQFLTKPSSIAIIEALDSGLSVRATAQSVGVSPNTVQKVKAARSKIGNN